MFLYRWHSLSSSLVFRVFKVHHQYIYFAGPERVNVHNSKIPCTTGLHSKVTRQCPKDSTGGLTQNRTSIRQCVYQLSSASVIPSKDFIRRGKSLVANLQTNTTARLQTNPVYFDSKPAPETPSSGLTKYDMLRGGNGAGSVNQRRQS